MTWEDELRQRQDEQAGLDWAKAHCPQAVVTVQRLSKAALDEAMKSDGLVPDAGATVEAPADRFFIR